LFESAHERGPQTNRQTKIHANASRHSALSYEHAGKIEAQLKAEVAELLARAEAADQADVADGDRTKRLFAAVHVSALVPRPKPWTPATASGFCGAPVADGHEARRRRLTVQRGYSSFRSG
jgi:hypothetical protein